MSLEMVAKRLTARSPRSLLRELIAQERPQGTRVTLTLYTSDGQAFFGEPLSIASDSGDEWLVLRRHDPGSVGLHLIYLSLSRISALELPGAERWAPELSSGEVPRPAGENAPGSLELKRAFGRGITLQGRQTTLPLEVSESLLKGSPESRVNLQLVAEALPMAIARLATGRLGQEALATVAKIVVSSVKDAFHARYSSGVLTLEIDLDRALPNELGKRLEDAFSKAL